MKTVMRKIFAVALITALILGQAASAFAAVSDPASALDMVFSNVSAKSTFILERFMAKQAVPGFTDQEVIDYFIEVAYAGEFEGSRDFCIKYVEPVYYEVMGQPSEEDSRQLAKLMEALNAIPGFPGIKPSDGNHPAQMVIYFGSEAFFKEQSGVIPASYSWGYASISYYIEDLKGQICDADVWINDEANPQDPDRNSIICEEIIQSLGMLNDSEKSFYSIFDQNRNDCRWPSELDWAMVRILYSPLLNAGDNEARAREVARQVLNSMK